VEAPFNKVSVSAGASTSRRKSFVPTHGTVSKFTYPIDTTLQNFTNPAWKAEKIDNRNPQRKKSELENRIIPVFEFQRVFFAAEPVNHRRTSPQATSIAPEPFLGATLYPINNRPRTSDINHVGGPRHSDAFNLWAFGQRGARAKLKAVSRLADGITGECMCC
jgi:hypothetical protein